MLIDLNISDVGWILDGLYELNDHTFDEEREDETLTETIVKMQDLREKMLKERDERQQ